VALQPVEFELRAKLEPIVILPAVTPVAAVPATEEIDVVAVGISYETSVIEFADGTAVREIAVNNVKIIFFILFTPRLTDDPMNLCNFLLILF